MTPTDAHLLVESVRAARILVRDTLAGVVKAKAQVEDAEQTHVKALHLLSEAEALLMTATVVTQ